ncbi:MAG TPA: 2-succinyl-5-enolpyruvyl-6-hydroxy-3-cyclohexene-1-carboxylic-acid synthase [Kofleriaceae bacterium]|nr:2-succinyl-5-enolpyruvyl-6-hydroxy-3-cyclohexene-1-carboxylic-acid synthase [Kofleriaceae bacterium]
MTAAVQTIWTELLVGTLIDAGVATCVISPGSRSTPLVAALAQHEIARPTIIDERAAAFYALGVARATNQLVALVCTSGSAAAHYYPAIVEASMAGVPLLAITSDRPPELQHCGASQTIDQIGMYGGFVRAAYDVGAPAGSEAALAALRRTVLQAIASARGPRPGPVQLEVPLRKPLEPAAPSSDDDRALARAARSLRKPVRVAVPALVADAGAVEALAARIAGEPRGVIVAGALPTRFARESAHALAVATGYPLLAEASSQLRFGSSASLSIDHFDLILAAKLAPAPAIVIRIGAEPVAAAWQGAFRDAEHWQLCDAGWLDPDSRAAQVLAGDVAMTLAALARPIAARERSFADAWLAADRRAAGAIEIAAAAHPRNEGDAVRAAIGSTPPRTLVQLGNSLPIRIVDLVCPHDLGDRRVISQRGAAGIDGLVASAIGATAAGPVTLVVGDVSFAHDVGSLALARHAAAPLAIVVIDNAGGHIFDALPIASHVPADTFARHWLTAPELDPVAIARAFGVAAIRAESPSAIAAAVAEAHAGGPRVTVIHAPVSPTGARDLRATAIATLNLKQDPS